MAGGYAFSWVLPTLESEDNCHIDPRVSGSAWLEGKVFGASIDVLSVSAKAGVLDIPSSLTAERIFTTDASIQIFDIDLLGGAGLPTSEPLEDATYHVIIEGDPTEDWQETLLQTIVTVGPIPITLKAGIAGAIGTRYEVAGGIPEGKDCLDGYLSLRGRITPHANLDVFASASLDALVVEAGIQANLTLVEMSLPFQVDMAMGLGPPVLGVADSTYLDLGTRLDLTTSLLSGSLEAFVEVCYIIDCERFAATLFRWDGPSHTLNLFEAGARLELGNLRTIQGLL